MSFNTSFKGTKVKKKTIFEPYLFIQTDFSFSKNTYPVFALMLANQARYIKELNLKDRSIDEQILAVSKIVKEHYINHLGEFPIWGHIQKYLYFYQPERSLVFDTQGSLINLKQRN